MALKCCTKLETAKERCPIVFQGNPSNFKFTRDKTSPILTQIGRFQTIAFKSLRFALFHQECYISLCTINFCIMPWRFPGYHMISSYVTGKNLYCCGTDIVFSCDQAALQMVFSVCLSVRPSVRPSHLFDYVPIIVSSWNFQELLPVTEVTSVQKVKVRGQRSRSQRSQPNFTVSGL